MPHCGPHIIPARGKRFAESVITVSVYAWLPQTGINPTRPGASHVTACGLWMTLTSRCAPSWAGSVAMDSPAAQTMMTMETLAFLRKSECILCIVSKRTQQRCCTLGACAMFKLWRVTVCVVDACRVMKVFCTATLSFDFALRTYDNLGLALNSMMQMVTMAGWTSELYEVRRLVLRWTSRLAVVS